MRFALTSFICLFMGSLCRAQHVYTITADSVKITDNAGPSELILQNHTQGIPGFLFNTGNGRTAFQRVLNKVSGSVYLIGADTLNVPPVWSQIGNAGTSPASNFMGTTDNTPLNFRVNNIFAGTVNPTNGNTAFGYQALYDATSGINGIDNTAVGANALASTTGNANVGLGVNACISNTTGQYNVALGVDAIEYAQTGSGNIAIGFQTMPGLTTGSGNTSIGHYSGWNISTGSNNIAIGYGMGFPRDTSDQLAIGDHDDCWIYGIAGRIGINTQTPAYILDVNGQANANILSIANSQPYTPGDSALYWNAATHKVEMGSTGTNYSFNGIGQGTPFVSTGSGAGSGASVSIDGSNEGGLITLTTGAAPSASATVLTVTYSTAFPGNSYALIRAANAATVSLQTGNQATFPSASATGFSMVGSTTALSGSTTYKWYYTITGK